MRWLTHAYGFNALNPYIQQKTYVVFFLCGIALFAFSFLFFNSLLSGGIKADQA